MKAIGTKMKLVKYFQAAMVLKDQKEKHITDNENDR